LNSKYVSFVMLFAGVAVALRGEHHDGRREMEVGVQHQQAVPSISSTFPKRKQ
jgi:hypothetical protein